MVIGGSRNLLQLTSFVAFSEEKEIENAQEYKNNDSKDPKGPEYVFFSFRIVIKAVCQ
jgi:hypothetical protein